MFVKEVVFVHKRFTFSYMRLGWFLYTRVKHSAWCAVFQDLIRRNSAQCAGCAQNNTKVLVLTALFKF